MSTHLQQSSEGAPRRFPWVLLAAVAAYVAFRALVLHTNFEAVSLPIYEMAMGNIAKCAVEGVDSIPLHQYYDNCGGHLMTGLFAIPFFATVGDSYLALKLVPVTLGLLTLLLLWGTLNRFVSRTAADVGAFLFALGPPTLSKYSMLAKGNHFENLFFQLGVYFVFLWSHRTQRKGLAAFLLGLTAGFAIFFYFGSLAIVALVAGTHFLVRGLRGTLADLRYALPGFVVGLSPLIFVTVLSGRPLVFLSHKLGSEQRASVSEALGRLLHFFEELLPRSGCYEDFGPVPAGVGEYLFIGAFAVAWLALAPRIARGLAGALRSWRGPDARSQDAVRERFEGLRLLPLVAYFPLVLCAIGLGNFRFKYYAPPVEVGQFRYLVPHFMYATMVIGIGASVLLARRGAARWTGLVLAAAALTTTLFTVPVIDTAFRRTGHGPAYDGYMFRGFAHVLMRDFDLDPETGRHRWDDALLRERIEAWDNPDRHWIYEGVGKLKAMAWLQDRVNDAGETVPGSLDLDVITAPFPEDVHIDLAFGAGSMLRLLEGPDSGKIGGAIRDLDFAADPLAPWVITGLAADSGYPLINVIGMENARTNRLRKFVPEGALDSWHRGRGMTAGLLLSRGLDADLRIFERLLAETPAGALAEFWFGVGWGSIERFELGPPPDLVTALRASELRDAYFQGLGAGWRHYHGLDAAPRLYEGMQPHVDANALGTLEAGLRWPTFPAPYRL